MRKSLVNRLSALRGVFVPLITPFMERSSGDVVVDEASLVKHVSRLLATNAVNGFVVGGSNGEYALQSDDERVRCVKLCKEAVVAAPDSVRKDVPILGGCVRESTHDTITLGHRMLDAGATGLLILHPSYYKASMHEEALFTFYSAVAKALSPAPIVVYNMPANTGIDLTASLVCRLAREHENVVGFKDSGGNIAKAASIVNYARQLGRHDTFSVLSGSAGSLLPALSVGCRGGICAYGNLDPHPLAAMVRFTEQSSSLDAKWFEKAIVIQGRIVDLNTAITATHGVPGLKYCMKRCGVLSDSSCRQPLLAVPPAAEAVLDALLRQAGLLRE